MLNIQTRLAGAEDIEAIATFQCHLASESEAITLDPVTVGKGVRAVIEDATKGCYWVADVDGQTVGCMMVLREWSDWRNAEMWWIHSLYVLPEFRRRGVLRAMYGHLKAIIEAEPSLGGLRLYVEKDNHVAMEAYEALGMDGEHYKLFEWIAP